MVVYNLRASRRIHATPLTRKINASLDRPSFGLIPGHIAVGGARHFFDKLMEINIRHGASSSTYASRILDRTPRQETRRKAVHKLTHLTAQLKSRFHELPDRPDRPQNFDNGPGAALQRAPTDICWQINLVRLTSAPLRVCIWNR